MGRRKFLRRGVLAVAALVALLGGLYAVSYIRQGRKKDPTPLFKLFPQEHLMYDVLYGTTKTGTVTVSLSGLLEQPDGSRAYRVSYQVKTVRAVGAVYRVDGHISVLIDAATLLPIEYEEKLTKGTLFKENARHRKYVYDRVNDELRYYRKKDENERFKLRRKPRKIPSDAHHYTSLLYFIRSVPLKLDSHFTATISDRKKDITVKLSVIREEDYVALSGERRTALVLGAALVATEEEIKDADPPTWLSRSELWLDKEERFPVRLDAKTKWGTMSAKLVERVITEDPSSQTNESGGNHTGQVPLDPAPR